MKLAADIASYVPGLNTVGGLTSAAINLAQGQYLAATLAAASAIPVAGVLVKATKATIAGIKAAKAAKAASGAIGAVGNAARTGLSNAQLVQKSANLAERAIGGSGRFAGTAKT